MVTLAPLKPSRGHAPPRHDGRMYQVSIDPGNDTGWALWSYPYPILAGAGIGMPPVDRACRLAIEKPQVYPKSPVPPNDLITLAFMAGRYAGMAAAGAGGAGGVEIVTVLPHEWKGTLPKDVCEARVRKALSLSEREVAEKAGVLVPKSLQNNMWDAIGIGMHVFKKVKI